MFPNATKTCTDLQTNISRPAATPPDVSASQGGQAPSQEAVVGRPRWRPREVAPTAEIAPSVDLVAYLLPSGTGERTQRVAVEVDAIRYLKLVPQVGQWICEQAELA